MQRRKRVAPLDGVRGVGVSVVVLYHLGASWLTGAWWLMCAFFVVSGFLITENLLSMRPSVRSVALFWGRRVRRLLPVLCLVVAVVVLSSPLWADQQRRSALGGEARAALGFLTNWWFIDRGIPYDTPAASASPMLHLWSLAVEEQFYLLWPLVVFTVLWAAGRWARPVIAGIAVGLTAASAVSMVLVHQRSGVWPAYFSTVTRAHGLMIGALVAVWWTALSGRWARVAAGLAWPSAVLLVGLTLLWPLNHPAVYRGGMVAAELLIAVVVVAVVAGSGPSRALSWGPLVRLGRLSYPIYLWHWPVIVALTQQRVGVAGAPLAGLRLGVIAVLSVFTHLVVEMPALRTTRVGTATISAAVSWMVVAALSFTVPAGAVSSPEKQDPEVPSVTVTPLQRVIVVGDSVALSAVTGFNRVAGAGFAVTFLAAPGCGWASASAAIDSAVVDEQRCSQLRERRVRDAARVDWVVALSAAELIDRRDTDGRWPLGTPQGDRIALDEMRSTASALTAGGARLVVVAIPPPGRESVTPILVDNDENRIRQLNRLIGRLSEEKPDILVVDPTPVLCPGGCTSDTAAEFRDSDGRHFTELGAIAVANLVLSSIAAQVPPP